MSLLLALTGGGSSVTGAAATSQAQTSDVAGSFTAAGGVVGTLVSAQAQTAAATGSAAPANVSGTATTAQAQTGALAGNASPANVNGTNTTLQVQTSLLNGSFSITSGVNGGIITTQGQTLIANGSVSTVVVENPFWLSWHLQKWVEKKKKNDDEVSLKEVAKNIVELIDEKPKTKLAKQFKKAIERQQDLEKQRISNQNAEIFIRHLMRTSAEYERKQKIEAELQKQFDIDEEEAILLLL
jgi:hypothetical protein